MVPLLTLPIFILSIVLFRNLRPMNIFIYVRNVCISFDLVSESYHPYQMNSRSLLSCDGLMFSEVSLRIK